METHQPGPRGSCPRTLISTQVVKIDIDTPAVELAIVEAIAERPEIAALIDELYFEYHFYFDGKDFGWGKRVSGDVDTAMGLMLCGNQSLRRASSRARMMRFDGAAFLDVRRGETTGICLVQFRARAARILRCTELNG